MALWVLLTDCLFFSGVREFFAFADGAACVSAKPNVPFFANALNDVTKILILN